MKRDLMAMALACYQLGGPHAILAGSCVLTLRSYIFHTSFECRHRNDESIENPFILFDDRGAACVRRLVLQMIEDLDNDSDVIGELGQTLGHLVRAQLISRDSTQGGLYSFRNTKVTRKVGLPLHNRTCWRNRLRKRPDYAESHMRSCEYGINRFGPTTPREPVSVSNQPRGMRVLSAHYKDRHSNCNDRPDCLNPASPVRLAQALQQAVRVEIGSDSKAHHCGSENARSVKHFQNYKRFHMGIVA